MCEFEKGMLEIGVPCEVVDKIIKYFGGEMIYIPKKNNLKSSRDGEIKSRFTGDNLRELAKEYGLTVRYVRTLLDGKNPKLTAA